jgi:hypothetical protein
MTAMAMAGISIGVGTVAVGIARFGAGYSWAESLTIGAEVAFTTFLCLLPGGAALKGASFLPRWGLWLSRLSGFSMLGFQILINSNSVLCFDPGEAMRINNAWLDNLGTKLNGCNANDIRDAQTALKPLLLTAAKTPSIYSIFLTIAGIVSRRNDLGWEGPSPCYDWTQAVLKEYKTTYDSNKELFDRVGIKLCRVQWDGGPTDAHYTIEIDVRGEKWEIDNGFAWLDMYGKHEYYYGAVFKETWYNTKPGKRINDSSAY